MCFTINVNIVREEMERRFGATFDEPSRYEPNYYMNAFTHPEVAVITSQSPEKIQLYKWGLIPYWVKDRQQANDIRNKTFNAKAETVHEKPSFRKPIKSDRCLIPATGFFEWQTRKEGKIPHYIYLKKGDPFGFAGICDHWVDRDTGEIENTFSIITTRANPLLEVIHNSKKRMPVILVQKNEDEWLNPGIPLDQVLSLLAPFPDSELGAHTISKMITTRGVDKNVPELIEPYQYPELP